MGKNILFLLSSLLFAGNLNAVSHGISPLEKRQDGIQPDFNLGISKQRLIKNKNASKTAFSHHRSGSKTKSTEKCGCQ